MMIVAVICTTIVAVKLKPENKMCYFPGGEGGGGVVLRKI